MGDPYAPWATGHYGIEADDYFSSIKRTDVGIFDLLTKQQIADRRWLSCRQQEYLDYEKEMNMVRQRGAFDFVGDGKLVRNRPYLTHPCSVARMRYFRDGFFVPRLEFYRGLEDHMEASIANVFVFDRYYRRSLEKG